MKRVIDYFRSCCRLTLRGCDPERCLDRFLAANIPFWQIEKSDGFTLSLCLYASDAPLAQSLARRCQCEGELVPLKSFRRDIAGLLRRWVFLLGMAAAIAGIVIVPNFVVALDVEGCENLEPAVVLRALETLDVRFGTWGPSIDNEHIKNEMLRVVPELRWISVNVSGMRATVLVAERSRSEPAVDRREAVTNLVSCADGIVTEMTVMNGQAACAVGDAVVEGQVLVSGLVDLERCTMYTRSLGEVYADTRRQITVLTPAKRTQRQPQSVAGYCVYVTCGRKRIKIFGNSGIFMGDCVKMIRREALSLPGGVEIPLALWIESYYHTTPKDLVLEEQAAKELFADYTARWVDRELVAGQVLTTKSEPQTQDGVYALTQTLHCREMIARSVEIPILELREHGTNDQRGTDGASD